jgi:hypothetical protein
MLCHSFTDTCQIPSFQLKLTIHLRTKSPESLKSAISAMLSATRGQSTSLRHTRLDEDDGPRSCVIGRARVIGCDVCEGMDEEPR